MHYEHILGEETVLRMSNNGRIETELLEEGDINGLEEFLMGVEDERTREAVIELLEAKQIGDEKQVAMRMRRIIRQLPDDVIRKLLEIYKNTFPR
ncbi:hypothetical protein Y032_0249g117 [Ancylostoma ceylanicum]|uniref:Uncharacterized protein n=1 Tax=Ancylostoma ceylanicum TaxID=53326 RepID=A0A016SDD6_9BILA|nr:hypothetical protein Y032_0249g117 [Ancylostoma ceylanicum]